MMKIPRLIILILFLAATVFSQTDELQQKVKGFKNNRRFTVKYDKFKDLTTVTAGPFGTGKVGGGLGGGISFKGQKPEADVTYYFIFDSYSSDWLYLRESDRELYSLIDGERKQLGSGDREGEIARSALASLGGIRVHERLVYEISEDLFRQIATGKSVEMQIGGHEFKLKEEHQQVFRDLLSLAKPG